MPARGEDDPVTDSASPGLIERGQQLWRTALTDLSETDARVDQLDDAERRTVERHSLGNRLSHWSQVLLFVLLLWTGLAIWSGNYVLLESGIWSGYYVAFGIHMWAGILVLAVTFVIFPFYYVLVDDHRQLLEMADVQVGVAIAAAFAGLRKYLPYYHDARRAYDEDEGDWMAHHPMQKTFFWWIAIFVGILALTGFGMYREMTTEPTWWVTWLGFLSGWFSFELLKQVHLLLAFVTASMVVFHIYFAVLPGNWDILRSMVFGDVKAYVVHGRRNDDGPRAPRDGESGPAAADGGPDVDRDSGGASTDE